MIRTDYLREIYAGFELHKVVAILGPRQCGKTTLANQYLKENAENQIHYFDLENPTDLALLENPKTVLEPLEGLIVIDEIQKIPDLFPIIRVLVDRTSPKQQYLILGSASRDLIQQSSETLAGRIDYLELKPFSMAEVDDLQKLWHRGGFPLSYLAPSGEQSVRWRKNYIQTFLERDIPNLGIRIPTQNLYRFWMMLVHCHGNYFNASELGRSLGHSHSTMRNYCDLLTETFMIRQLQPWYENISKRQVKTPKIYFRDSGILHALLDLDEKDILRHPKLGASWEGFALEEVIRALNVRHEQCYFWASQGEAEIDLLVFKGGKRLGFEFKFSDKPAITRSIRKTKEILKLDQVTVIHPGDKVAKMEQDIYFAGLQSFLTKQLTDFGLK